MYPETKRFHPSDLRGAVEFLKTVENRTKFTKLMVKARVRAGHYKIDAPATLSLEEMLGKTPAQVWELLDRQIDEQIAYFKRK